MRRTLVPIYALVLLETLVWIAIVPLAPTFAAELHLSPVETGMILSAASLAALVIALPFGRLADRVGARRVTIASAALFTLSTLGQGLADEFWSLMLSRAMFGLAFGTMWGAGAAWLSDSLTDERRAGALAAATTVSGVGFTVGPVFAGTLADRSDTGTPFLLVAVAAAAVTGALVVAAPAATWHSTHEHLPDVLRAAGRDKLVLAAIVIIALIGLVGGGVNLLVPLRLRANGVSAGEIGLLFSVGSGIYTVVSAVVARLGARAASLRVGGAAALGTGGSLLLVLVSSSTLAASAFVLLRAPFWSTMDTIILPLAAAGAHRSSIGRGSVMGLLTLGWAAASTVGPLLAGAISSAAGDTVAFATMVVWCVLAGVWLLRRGRRSRQSASIGATFDLDRLYGAPNLDDLREEYDRIASVYDEALVDGMGYRSPQAVAEVARKILPPDALLLDAGAGTGLLGVALAEAGFTQLDGMDMSREMLAHAARTHVYRDLREGRLGERLDYETGTYDGVASAGVLTTGHAPARCLDEFVRVTRPGGHLIFTLRADRMPPGYADKLAELKRTRRLELVEKGDEFQALPVGEPEVLVRVWVFRVG
ncbi:MAG: MFS transporter [Actinobacteria bacterium]|nr:MAG: MFS transporter [Actinomycetota bacterium]